MFDRPAKIEYLPIAPERRVLVIADVHGNLPYLRGVLDLASFGGDDLVIFDGDFLEKGPQSLETLRFVMALRAAGRAGAVLLPFSVFVTYMAAKAGRKKTTAVSSYRQTEEYDEKSLQAHGL